MVKIPDKVSARTIARWSLEARIWAEKELNDLPVDPQWDPHPGRLEEPQRYDQPIYIEPKRPGKGYY